jgi:hypothetical protein
MRKILYWIFGKPQYYYNPVLTKGEGEKPMYMVSVCEYWRGKKKPVKAFAGRNPVRILTRVREYVDSMNQNVK